MKRTVRILLIPLFVFSVACAWPQSEPSLPNSPSTGPRRVQVNEDSASEFLVHKTPITYPDAARNAGIQGTVVLKVVTSYSGDVEEVTVVSGDPGLAQAAADTVRQWKYKPYLLEGSPAEMETQVSINFHIRARTEPAPPPPGSFRENSYRNNYFEIYYPLSRDWVRETELTRTRLASENKGTYVLLSAVHIPQDTDPLRADSSFTVLALGRSDTLAPDECKRYLEVAGQELRSRKEGQPKGDVSQFTIAGHDFYRGDFEYRHGTDHGAVLCTAVKEYLLQWRIVGWSKQAIETAVATLNTMRPMPQTPPQQGPAPPAEDSKAPTRVKVDLGVSQGLLIKKAQPIYPEDARRAHIEGTVRMNAVINKNGDVVDLEVLDGPIELVVSAVNAVRKWKYRPYQLMGNPVEVQTQIQVNYILSGL